MLPPYVIRVSVRPLLAAVCLLLAHLASAEAGHKCGHIPPQRVGYSATTSTRTRRQATEREPIRIVPWYYKDDFNQLSSGLRDKYKYVVNQSISYLSSFLKVDRLTENITLQRFCNASKLDELNPYDHCTSAVPCQATDCAFPEFPVPEEHLKACKTCDTFGSTNCSTEGQDGPGVADADFVIYVAAKVSECDKYTLAYAAHCFHDRSTDRPIAGGVNLCPRLADKEDIDSIVHTVVHELTHALVFSPLLMPLYRDENGNPRTPRDGFNRPTFGFHSSGDTIVHENVQREALNGVYDIDTVKVVTPAVLREARNHFGCPTLNGMELENLGGGGRAFSHWKKRLVENEAMTGIASTNEVFSRLTFALYEDSGWYDVDYSVASPLRFGQCLGCDFAEKSCFSYGLDKEPFCKEQEYSPFRDLGSRERGANTSCTYDRLAVATCNLVNVNQELNEDIPFQYQYFHDPVLGGKQETIDYCPIRYSESGYHCQRQRDLGDNVFLESVGSSSKCVDFKIGSNLEFSSKIITPIYGGACYEVSCSPDGNVTIIVGDTEVFCQWAEQEFIVQSMEFDIVIICPAFEDICWEKFTTCSATSPPSGLSQGGVIAIGVVVGLLSLVVVVIAALIVVAVMYKCRRKGGKSYSRHSGRPDNIRDSYNLIGEGLPEEEA